MNENSHLHKHPRSTCHHSSYHDHTLLFLYSKKKKTDRKTILIGRVERIGTCLTYWKIEDGEQGWWNRKWIHNEWNGDRSIPWLTFTNAPCNHRPVKICRPRFDDSWAERVGNNRSPDRTIPPPMQNSRYQKTVYQHDSRARNADDSNDSTCIHLGSDWTGPNRAAPWTNRCSL